MNAGMRQLLEDIVEMDTPVLLQRQEQGLAKMLEKSGYIKIAPGGWATATDKGIGFCTGENG